MGQSPSSSNYSNNSDETVLIQGNQDLQNGYIIPRIYTSQITKLSKPGDIILTVRAPVGDIAINEYTSCIGRGVCSITPKEDKKFIYYYLQFLNNKNIWNKYSQGSTFESVNSKDIKNLKINIPTLNEQKYISEFFSLIDQKISFMEIKRQKMDEVKNIFLQKLFCNKQNVPELRFPEFEEEWEEILIKDKFDFFSTNSLSRAKLDKEKGEIGNIHYGDIHTKFPSIVNVKKEEIPFISEEIDDEKINKYEPCQNGDLLIADASEDYADIGKTIELQGITDEKIVGGLHTLLLRDKTIEVSPLFNGYLFQNEKLKKQIKIKANGISVLGISKKELQKITIKIPSKEEQNKISDLLFSVDQRISSMENEIEYNINFKQSILTKMFC